MVDVQRWLDTLVSEQSGLPPDWEAHAWQILTAGTRRVYREPGGERWSGSGEDCLDQLLCRISDIANMTVTFRFAIHISADQDFSPGGTAKRTFEHAPDATLRSEGTLERSFARERTAYNEQINRLLAENGALRATIGTLIEQIIKLGTSVRDSAIKPMEMADKVGQLMQVAIAGVGMAATAQLEASEMRAQARDSESPLIRARADEIALAGKPVNKLIDMAGPLLTTGVAIPALLQRLGVSPEAAQEYAKALAFVTARGPTEPEPLELSAGTADPVSDAG